MQRSTRRAVRAAALSPLLLATGAWAQTQVQVYGVVDVAVGQYGSPTAGGPLAMVETKGVHAGGVTTNFIGFRGSEDLGGGLTAKFQIESFLRADTGESGRSGTDGFWNRESFVGVGGGFGEIRLGNNGNPMWLATLPVSAMGGNSRFSPIFRHLFNGGARGRSIVDTAMTNSIKYMTPDLSGFSGSVALQAGEGRGSRYNYAANVGYRGGPLLLSAGLQSARHQPPPGASALAFDQDMWVLGAAYSFGPVRLSAAYATVESSTSPGAPGVAGNNKSRIPQIGLQIPFGASQIQLAAGQDRNKINAVGGATTKRDTYSAGYVYSLSKRTDLYAFVMQEKIPVPAPIKSKGDSYMAGVRHAF